jgi:small GTP-binding protein
MDCLEVETKLFRVITIGDTSVGKTSIISQLVRGEFEAEKQSTVGAMFVAHVETIGARRIEMQVWDTAGQERFRSLGPIYYRNAAAAIVVFDLTSAESFQRLDVWVHAFRGIAGERAFVCVVGNKADLTDAVAVADDEARAWADAHHFPYVRTSAKTGAGVREVFRAVAEELLRRETQVLQPESPVESAAGEAQKCC